MPSERYAVLGDPIVHSLSPAMQSAAFAAAGLDAVYEAHRVSIADLPAHVLHLRYAGFRGFNITIPHKESMLSLVDELSDVAGTVGAVNTVTIERNLVKGDNTDVVGFLACLRQIGVDVNECEAVVFGSGGSARAVVYALSRGGTSVSVVTRDPVAAKRLDSAAGLSLQYVESGSAEALRTIERAGLLVNTTPLGMAMHALESPLPPTVRLNSGTRVIDLVYGGETPFLKTARLAGCACMDGVEMLVQQGAASFRLWTGIDPDIEAMRAACHEQLRRRLCSVS